MIMKADTREDIEVAHSRDICALIGVKDVATGDTLADKELDIRLEPPSFPEPLFRCQSNQRPRLIRKKCPLACNDLPKRTQLLVCLPMKTGQTIISGMGELHLEIIRDRLFREFKVEANAGKPQIAYRETMLSSSDGIGKFVRQSGGRGQYGHAVIQLEPLEKGKGMELDNKIVGEPFLRNLLSQLSMESRRQLGEWSQDIQLLILKLPLSTALIMMSIPLRWPSRWLVFLHSRMLCRKPLRFCLNRS